MMTNLKNMGGYKHSQLKAKSFEEIKGMYERQKKSVQDFVPIGSAEEEKLIKKMNEKATGEDTSNKEKVLEEPDSTKVEVKKEGNTESTRKRSGRRLKIKATKKSKRQKTDSDLEEEEQLKAFLVIVPDEEGEINYELLNRRYPIVNWESKFYHADRYGKPHDYYRVFRADGSLRHIKTFTEIVSRTMFEANAEDDLWKNQEEWILKSWNFYDNCGVHILVLEDGTKFYMLAKRRYLLKKETLERMLALRLIVESESEVVFDLLRFIQQKIEESGSHDGICQKLYGNQLTMLHSKELASPKQTARGKDISNPLIVDSLLKTIWLSMHHVMAAPTIYVSTKENLEDPINMRVDIIHPEPVEELTMLRFRVDIAEAKNASLCARIKTNEAVEKITHNHERLARIRIEQQLAMVQESHRQDREDFRKLKVLVTSQFG
ncbi:hypothetical protein Tco_0098397 [Tanacetum coccineum]